MGSAYVLITSIELAEPASNALKEPDMILALLNALRSVQPISNGLTASAYAS